MFLALKRLPTSQPLIDSLQYLPEQIRSVFYDTKKLTLPFSTKNISNIVINGMGGSNLGGYIIQAIFKDRLKTPLLIEPGYDVPAYVGKNTLYIVSSYSGTTEEPIAAYKIAKRRGAMIIIICSDSDNALRKIAERDNIAHYFFSTKSNPSGQPRLGLGYGIASLLLIFKKLGLISLQEKEIKDILGQLKRKNSPLTKPENEAKTLAKKLAHHETILIGGQIFEGNLRVARNQWCETGKNFASYLVLSDMNHFALEGLSKPSSNRKRLAALFFESDLYDTKISKRLELSKEVMRKQGIKVFSYKATGKTLLTQSFDFLQFNSWLTYYVSLQNRVNPLIVPWVDWFKARLLTK
ncbi:MAG TPA: SIS domain-containing protein [bacterium]|nr:SIS domain-containing protein [bacterium]